MWNPAFQQTMASVDEFQSNSVDPFSSVIRSAVVDGVD